MFITTTVLENNSAGIYEIQRFRHSSFRHHYDVRVLCIGWNNVANGIEPSDLLSRPNFRARRCIDSGLCTIAIIMGSDTL